MIDTELFQLSESQKRVWYTQKLYHNSSMFNIGGRVAIKGFVDVEMLKEAICRFVNSNDAFRIRIIRRNQEYVQYFSNEMIKKEGIAYFDFTQKSKDFLQNWYDRQFRACFELYNQPLYYFAVYQVSDQEFGYFVKLHHVIADGWSIQLLTNQISLFYHNLIHGEDQIDLKFHSYRDFLNNENQYLYSAEYEKNKKFWLDLLKGCQLKEMHNMNSTEGKREKFFFSKQETEFIHRYCLKHHVTLNTFFICLYYIYLNKTTQENDFIISNPVIGRSGKKERNIFGMFVSNMPFRYKIDDSLSMDEMMQKIQQLLFRCLLNQKYPYNHLVKDLNLKSYRLYTASVNCYNMSISERLGELDVQIDEFYNGEQEYLIQLIIRNWVKTSRLELDIDYCNSEYTKEDVERLYQKFQLLISELKTNGMQKIKQICLLDEEERIKVLDSYNDTKTVQNCEETVIDVFLEQVKKTPNQIVIEDKERRCTYLQLKNLSDYIRRSLIQQGVQRGDVIGICMVHSIELISTILGVMTLGCCYLPIDPSTPSKCVQYMISNSGAQYLIVDETASYIGKVSDTKILYWKKILELKDESSREEQKEAAVSGNELAYIIYTSGTTGQPKGVSIEHHGLINYIQWARKVYVGEEKEVFPLYSSLAFDLTVTSIFTPLISGSKIVIYNEEDDEYINVLYRIINDRKVTIMKLTPSHLILLAHMDLRTSSIKKLIVGGENLKSNLSRKIYDNFGGDITIFNEYGPTETVVGCMIHRYDPEKDTDVSVPIGVPADNIKIYVLDKNMVPVPVGTTGEIYISFEAESRRGYYNAPEITQQKFIEDPYDSERRMYKSGDLAKFSSGGLLYYKGRIDKQVKLNGHRIELDELENCINQCTGIIDSVVILDHGEKGENYLTAYLVKKSNTDIRNIERVLSEFLPEYMLPHIYIEIDKIPLDQNGKRDIDELKKMRSINLQQSEYVQPVTKMEYILLNAVCKIMDLDKISVTANLFDYGIDSIKAIQIAVFLSENDYKVKAKDILAHPTIRKITQYMTEAKGFIRQETCEGEVPPTAIIQWLFQGESSNRNLYNQSLFLQTKRIIDASLLEKVIHKIVCHHDSLRLNYNIVARKLYYNNEHLTKPYAIKEYDLTSMNEDEQQNKMNSIAQKILNSFQLSNDILMKLCVFRVAENTQIIFITAHHIVVDKVSWDIILNDISLLIDKAYHNMELILPSKTDSFQTYALALNKYRGHISEKVHTYWDNIMSMPDVYCHIKGSDDEVMWKRVHRSLDQSMTTRFLNQTIQSYHTNAEIIVLTILMSTIKELIDCDDIVVDMEHHGRDEILEGIDISRTVGWFTTIYPLRVKLVSDDLTEQITLVEDAYHYVPNRGFDYLILNQSENKTKSNKSKNIRFNYLGNMNREENDYFEVLDINLGLDIDEHGPIDSIFDFNCMIYKDKLHMDIMFRSDTVKEAFVEEFITLYSSKLKELILIQNQQFDYEKESVDLFTADLTIDDFNAIFDY